MTIELTEKTLHFKTPARTSRGEYVTHRMLLLKVSDGKRQGVGECAPLPDLSSDRSAYDDLAAVRSLLEKIIGTEDKPEEILTNAAELLRPYPALLFALESALAEMTQASSLYDSPFARSELGIPINGLVWMGDYRQMLSRLEEKLESGYRCVKLKIGAIDWEDELRLLRLVRSRFSSNELQLRVDANGAFLPSEVDSKLEELSRFGLHSIEQPVRAGQWELMARLAQTSPVPIALDEELVGIDDFQQRKALLDYIRPQYIVVKPTLHGGMSGAREWISLASQRGISSWITSALESNVGLKNVALLCASVYGLTAETASEFPAQGLGTGLLFTDNIDNGVTIRDGHIWISR